MKGKFLCYDRGKMFVEEKSVLSINEFLSKAMDEVPEYIKNSKKIKYHRFMNTIFDTKAFDERCKVSNIINNADIVVVDTNQWYSSRTECFGVAYIYGQFLIDMKAAIDEYIPETDFCVDTKNINPDDKIYMNCSSRYVQNYGPGYKCRDFYVTSLTYEMRCAASSIRNRNNNKFPEIIDKYFVKDGYYGVSIKDGIVDHDTDDLFVNCDDAVLNKPVVTLSAFRKAFGCEYAKLTSFEEAKNIKDLFNSPDKNNKMIGFNLLINCDWEDKESLPYLFYIVCDGFFLLDMERDKRMIEIDREYHILNSYYQMGAPRFLNFIRHKGLQIPDDLYREYVKPYYIDRIKCSIEKIDESSYDKFIDEVFSDDVKKLIKR